jgi:hypothetical protein
VNVARSAKQLPWKWIIVSASLVVLMVIIGFKLWGDSGDRDEKRRRWKALCEPEAGQCFDQPKALSDACGCDPARSAFSQAMCWMGEDKVAELSDCYRPGLKAMDVKLNFESCAEKTVKLDPELEEAITKWVDNLQSAAGAERLTNFNACYARWSQGG